MIKYYCDECGKEFNSKEDTVYKITISHKLPGEKFKIFGKDYVCVYCYDNIAKAIVDNGRNN